MNIKWNDLVKNHFFTSTNMSKLDQLDDSMRTAIINHLGKKEGHHLSKDKIRYFKPLIYPTVFVIYKIDTKQLEQYIEKSFEINKRIWWLIHKWKFIKNWNEKDFVFENDVPNHMNYDHTYFVYINFQDLEALDYEEELKIYPHYLKSIIKSWSNPINELQWALNNYNDFNHDRGIKDGEEQLLINEMLEKGFIKKNDYNFYPTSKLRKFSHSFSYGHVFVAMQFKGNDKRLSVIKETLEINGIKPIRADDICEPGVITSQIFEAINQSNFVIADLSDGNNGVYFEAGYAMALKKDVVFINQQVSNKIHFDIKHYRHIEFINDQDLKAQLNLWVKNKKRNN